MASLDSFKARKTLKVGAKTYVYYSLEAAAQNGLGDISRLPVSLKVLLENLLRFEDGKTVTQAGREPAPPQHPDGQGDRGGRRRALCRGL